MKIKVIFANRKKSMIGSELIKWLEKTDYSHVCLLFEDGYIYESVFPHFRRINMSDWIKFKDVVKVVELDCLLFDYNNAHHKAVSLIGKPYGVTQLGLIFLENMFKRVYGPLGEAIGAIKLNNNRQLICTESNIVILKEIGLKVKGSHDTISLNDFDSIVSKFKQEKNK